LAEKDEFANGKGNNRETQPLNDRNLYYHAAHVVASNSNSSTTNTNSNDGANQLLASVAVLISALALF